MKIGDKLHSSCRGAFYGEVVAMGKDASGFDTIDIALAFPDSIVEDDREPGPGASEAEQDRYLSNELFVEFPPGVVIARNVRYRLEAHEHSGSSLLGKPAWDWPNGQENAAPTEYVHTNEYVVAETPGRGCYRCDKAFFVCTKPDAQAREALARALRPVPRPTHEEEFDAACRRLMLHSLGELGDDAKMVRADAERLLLRIGKISIEIVDRVRAVAKLAEDPVRDVLMRLRRAD